ncbi:MAG: hypothetical protein ACE5GE_13135 [Phycisphaerae bacterium]
MNRMMARFAVGVLIAGFCVAGISVQPAAAAAPVGSPSERLVCDVLGDWLTTGNVLDCPASIASIRVPDHPDRQRMLTTVRRALQGYSMIWIWGPEDRLLLLKYLGQDLVSTGAKPALTGKKAEAQVFRALKNLTTPQLHVLARASSQKPLAGNLYSNPAYQSLFQAAQIQSPEDWSGKRAMRIKRWIKKVFQSRRS